MESVASAAERLKAMAEDLCDKAKDAAAPPPAGQQDVARLMGMLAKNKEAMDMMTHRIKTLFEEKERAVAESRSLRQQLQECQAAAAAADTRPGGQGVVQMEEQYSKIITQQEAHNRKLELNLKQAREVIEGLEARLKPSSAGGGQLAEAAAAPPPAVPSSCKRTKSPQASRRSSSTLGLGSTLNAITQNVYTYGNNGMAGRAPRGGAPVGAAAAAFNPLQQAVPEVGTLDSTQPCVGVSEGGACGGVAQPVPEEAAAAAAGGGGPGWAQAAVVSESPDNTFNYNSVVPPPSAVAGGRARGGSAGAASGSLQRLVGGAPRYRGSITSPHPHPSVAAPRSVSPQKHGAAQDVALSYLDNFMEELKSMNGDDSSSVAGLGCGGSREGSASSSQRAAGSCEFRQSRSGSVGSSSASNRSVQARGRVPAGCHTHPMPHHLVP